MRDLIRRAKFPSAVDWAAVAADWRRRGFSCALFVDPPGGAWIDFVHAANELVLVVEGRIEVTVGGQSFIAEAGDEIFIPRGATHSLRNIHCASTRWLYGYDAAP